MELAIIRIPQQILSNKKYQSVQSPKSSLPRVFQFSRNESKHCCRSFAAFQHRLHRLISMFLVTHSHEKTLKEIADSSQRKKR